jgi:fatty acid desaturase
MEPTTTRSHTTAYDPWRRTLLTTEQVRSLSQLSPARVEIDAARSWALIIGAWAAVAYHPSWWVVLPAIPLIGSAYYALFIIGHDGLHRRLFHGKARNDLFNDLVVLGPIGAITRINNLNHLQHHDQLATPNDPDRHKYGCFNKWESGRLIAYLSGVATLITSTRHVYVTNSSRSRAAAGPVPGPRGYTARDLVILAGWQVALIAGLALSIGWWAWPLLWLVPVFGFTFLMDNLRTFCEHSQPEADGKADSHRLISYLSTPLERWFISPMNMNIHAIHHLWPSIPYYHLPQAARLVRARPGGGGPLEWRRSYLGYLWRYWRALPLEECRVSPVQAA